MAALYADENFPLEEVLALRRLGHDVLTVHEAGQANRGVPDPEVLAFASAHGRAVVTLNRRHFVRLHRHAPDHAGIIVCSQDPDTERQALRIDAAVREAGALHGLLLRVNLPPQ